MTFRALLLACIVLTGCSSPPAPVIAERKPEPWYAPAVEELAMLARNAEGELKRGRSAEAAALIEKGQPLMNRVLSVPRPSLAAMEAAALLDDLYGSMLLANRHYGDARLLFQKNVARWKNWRPQSPDTTLRLKQAQARIAECDRHLAE